MKLFVKRCFAFLAPCVILCTVVSFAAVFGEYRVYLSHVRIPEGVRYVVVGDSQSECALDPSVFPELSNQAVRGLSLEQMLYKVRDLVRVNGDREFTVILDVSPSRLAKTIEPMESSDYSSRHAVLNFAHLLHARRSLDEPLLLLRDRVLKNAFSDVFKAIFGHGRRRKKKNKDFVWGGFAPFDEAMFLSDHAAAETESVHYAEEVSTTCGGEDSFLRNEALLSEIIETVLKSGRNVVLTTSPWHSSLISRIPRDVPERFIEAMQAYSSRYGIAWHNNLAWNTSDDGWLDQNHLNATGAARYTRFLRSLILSANGE